MVSDDKLKFVSTKDMTDEQLELLVKALDLNPKNLICRFCNNKLALRKAGIFPSVAGDKTATIVCGDNPLCIIEYLEEFDNEKEKNCCRDAREKVIQKCKNIVKNVCADYDVKHVGNRIVYYFDGLGGEGDKKDGD